MPERLIWFTQNILLSGWNFHTMEQSKRCYTFIETAWKHCRCWEIPTRKRFWSVYESTFVNLCVCVFLRWPLTRANIWVSRLLKGEAWRGWSCRSWRGREKSRSDGRRRKRRGARKRRGTLESTSAVESWFLMNKEDTCNWIRAVTLWYCASEKIIFGCWEMKMIRQVVYLYIQYFST